MKLEKITARGADGLYREETTKIIYLRKFRKGSGEIKISLRTTSLEEAKKKRDEQLKVVGFSKVKGRKTAIEVYDLWIERRRTQNKSAATITSMLATRNFLEPFFSTMFPDEITSAWWDGIFIPNTKFIRLSPLRDRETKKWTRVQRPRKTPRKFFNDWKWLGAFTEQCLEDGLIQKAPQLNNPDPEREPGKVYTDKEIAKLLANCHNADLKIAILMGVTMGMRRGEIFGLKSDRIDIKAGVVRLKAADTKIRRARAFALSPAVKAEVIARAKAGPWIFPASAGGARHKDGYMRAWRSLKRATGIEGRFHFLRHTFLTKAFKAPGANPALICHYAGLSLQVAQKVYLHFDDEDTRQVSQLVHYDI